MPSKLYSGYPVDFYDLQIVVSVDDKNNIQYSFNKKFVDITPKPISTDNWDDIARWYSDPMLFYFQQYKFALYCATALCGVSKDQLTHGLPLTKSIMNFHVMYQTKRILHQMQARNPGDSDFNPLNNPYNKTEYHKLLNEFSVRTDDIPEIDQPANGLGYVITPRGKLADQYLEAIHKLPNFPSTGQPNRYINVKPKGSREHNTYPEWGTYYQFAKEANHSVGTSMNKVQQDTFYYFRVIPDHGNSLTPAGLVRLNDSIRSYVYCLLGSQVQARAAAGGDPGSGKSLAAQQQFLVLVNDLIDKSQSLEESIKNFQDALSKTQGVINYVVKKGLYMIPSNMNLNKLGKSVEDFNDKLLIAKDFDGLGVKKIVVKPKPVDIKPPANAHDVALSNTPLASDPTPALSPLVPEKISTKSDLPSFDNTKVFSNNKPVITNIKKRSIEDTHEGTKLAIGGAIVASELGYLLLR